MKDLHGKAIVDYYQRGEAAELMLHNSYGPKEIMPVAVFFRDEEDLSTLEHLALIECTGKVLDVGAGAGAHSLILQERGFEVLALENSPGCVAVMSQSGVRQTLFHDLYAHNQKYDTLLILMNGLGLAGKRDKIPSFLHKCMTLLNTDGQILVDSSDISYLYEEDNTPKPEGYYGEVRYQYEYQGERGEWFDWVYVDQHTLKNICEKEGLLLEVLHTDENDQYLARIS